MGKTLGYGEITVANMTEPFTVMLTNEAQQFATDSNRKVTSAQSYYTDIIVIRGSQERTDYTIGNITSSSGITVSKSSKRVTFSVSAGTTIGADTGVIEIPITLDGQTVKKQFSWSCGKQGPQGVQGNDGNSFAWNMLSETNCGKKHWGTESSGGKYSVEDFITEDNIDAVKLICTEAISTSNWSYVLFKDIKMLKQLKPSTKYTLSYDIKANRSGAISHSICKGDVSNFCTNTIVVNNIIGNETWQHISVVLTTNDLKTTPTNEILYLGRNALSKVGYSIIKNLKLVEGDIDTPWSPSQSDIEGKGVVETVQYYLATSQASGVTSSTSGWSTDITTQKLTADKKYLWNCYQTKYSDGTSEPISTPKVIGVYGDKGANALQCKRNWTGTYTTINGTASAALSDFNRTPVAGDAFTALDGSSNTGTWQVISVSGSNVNIKLLSYVNSKGEKGDNAKNISITPSAQYFKSTDGGKTFAPNQITITPTLQGEISFGKWQYSIDGGVSFADVVSGQKGLTISNNVLSVSKDSSLYSDAVTMVTFRAVANDSSFYDTCSIAKIYDVSDIGDGRNLLWNSNFAKTDEAITGTTNSWGLHTRGTNLVASIDTSTKHNGFNTLKTVSAANGDKNSSNDLEWFAWGISERTSDNLHSKNQNYTLSFYAKASVTTDFIVRWGYDAYGADTTRTLTTNWQKYEIKLHQATSAYSITIIFKLLTAGTVWFSEFKLEKGSSATGYSTAPEDLQTAILSTKSEISDVSIKVNNNKQAIEQRVEKTTYEQDLNLVKGNISKANEGLNKWRYEIYPKSLFTSEYQGKSTMDVFAKNTNLTPSQSVLINDTDLSIAWNYDNNYIGYALTFAKFSAAKSVAITFAHDDGAHIYLNGKLIGGSDAYSQTGESLTLDFVKGWNCIEVVVNEGASTEGFKLGTTLSALPECQLMNCYYGTPVARQSHITNQLVENTTNIDGVSGSVQKVMSTVGGSSKIDEFVNNYSTWKKKVDGIETRVGETYTTKDDFNGLEIGGRNLVRLGGLSGHGATSFSYDKTTDTYTIVSPVVSTVWRTGAAVKYDDNHKVLIPYGKTYILSFEVKVPQALSINIDINNYAVSGSSWAGNDNDDGSTRGQSSYSIPANTWTKVWVRWANTNTKNTNKVDLYDNSSIGLVTKDCTSAVTWQIRHVKGELGNKPTDWTPAPEDVNGKIVNVETIANQTAKKFEWIVKGGDSSSNFTLTDRVADLVAERINFKGLVTFSGLNTDAKNEIGKVAQSKVDGLEVGGRNLLKHSSMIGEKLVCDNYVGCNNCDTKEYTNEGFHIITPTEGNANNGIAFSFDNFTILGINGGDTITFSCDIKGTSDSHAPFISIHISDNNWYGSDVIQKNTSVSISSSWQRVSVTITTPTGLSKNHMWLAIHGNYQSDLYVRNFKLEKGNKATDWMPAPEDVSQDASNKANQALTDAKNYSSNAVNWVTNNGSSTTSLNSMVKKWTDGAVSDTTQINGGWIKANTITASKIALADFTNYSQLTRDTADAYGFTVTDDTDGTWFSTKNIKRDQFISEIFPCNGGESYLIEYDISTNAKGANNSTDTKNYIGVAIGVYGYTGTVGSNGLPNKATNIWYADRITGSETAPSIHVKTTITTSTATKQFRVFLQSNGYYFEGTTKIRNLSVRRMYGGTLIVDGSITADKIATDAIKSRNYISSGGTQGSFLNLSDGSFTSPNLSWDSNGNLIAKNANLSGQINATKGTVGGWNIATNGLYSGIDENAIKIYSATTYDAQTMYQKQKIQDSFILSQKYINHFVSQQVSVGHNIPYWQTRSFIYNDSQIQLAQSDYCINTSSASNYDAQYSLKDGYISATRIYMEQNITQVGGDVINSSFSIGLDSMMGWCSIQSTKGINIYGNSSRALYVQSNDTSKYNALETEGDVVVNGKIHAVSGDNKIQLNSDNNGSIELYGNTPFIDFHSAYSSADYTCRIIANTPEQLLVCGKLRCDSNIISNNDLIANSWVYAGQNAHYTWQNQLDCYFSCGYYNNTNNIYYYAGYHAFYVNGDSGSGMMYIETSGVSSRKGFRNSSDERIKQNFSHFDDNFIDTYMSLEPVQYQFKNDTDDKYHFGFKAQQTERILNAYGQESDKSYGICATHAINPEKAEKLYGVKDMHEEYTLAYDELIAPTTYMVQHTYKELESTKDELTKVKQEKADLETRLQAIEAKLGL